MSSDSSDVHERLLADFLHEIRQFNSLGAFFFRAAAAQMGMNATDLQVIDILEINGPATAGQLAELSGLTTGAITGMIDRLEKGGLVRRESDPNDGRRVLVRLSPSDAAIKELAPFFDSAGQKWDELASTYDDPKLAFLIEFLRAGNAASRDEISRLRSAPKGAQQDFGVALGDITTGRLIFSSGASMLNLRSDDQLTDLYQAHFEGTPPEVKIENGTVTIRNRRRLWLLPVKESADIALNPAVPWSIEIRGGAAGVAADFTGIDLSDLNISYGMSAVDLKLPFPSGTIPLRFSGGASEFVIQRPARVPVRVRFIGWVSALQFDGEVVSGLRNDLRMQSPGYEAATDRYDIEISGSASGITISTWEN